MLKVFAKVKPGIYSSCEQISCYSSDYFARYNNRSIWGNVKDAKNKNKSLMLEKKKEWLK